MTNATPDVLVEALYDHVQDVWFIHDVPLFGVAVVNGQKFIFNAYSEAENMGPLYLYASSNDVLLKQVLEGKAPALELFTHPDVTVWKETVVEGETAPHLVEVDVIDLDQGELPLPGVYLNK